MPSLLYTFFEDSSAGTKFSVGSEVTFYIISDEGAVIPKDVYSEDFVSLSISDGKDGGFTKIIDLGTLDELIIGATFADSGELVTTGRWETEKTLVFTSEILGGDDLATSVSLLFEIIIFSNDFRGEDIIADSRDHIVDVSYKEEDEMSTEDGEEEEEGIIDEVKDDVESENIGAIKAESERVLGVLNDQEEINVSRFNPRVNSETGLLEIDMSYSQVTGSQSGLSSPGTILSSRLKEIEDFLRGEGFVLIKDKSKESISSSIGAITYKYTFSFGKSTSDFKQRLSKESLTALKAFDKIASLVLTETYLYCETQEEAKEELRRIQKVLGKNVLPIFFQSIETFVCNTNHVSIKDDDKYLFEKFLISLIQENFKEGVIRQDDYDNAVLVGGVAAEGVATAAALLAPGAAFPPIILLALVGLAGSLLIKYFDAKRLKDSSANRDRVIGGLRCLSLYLSNKELNYDVNEYIRCKKTFVGINKSKEAASSNATMKTLMERIAKSLGNSKEVQRAINEISSKYLPTFDLFKSFENIVYKIGAGGKVSNILKQNETQKTDLKNPLNFYSEGFIGRSLYLYLDYLFSFPYDFDDFPDTTGYSSLWNNYGDEEHLVDPPWERRKYLAYKESDEVKDYSGDEHLFSKTTMFNSQYSCAILKEETDKHFFFSDKDTEQYERPSEDLGKEIYDLFFKKHRELLKAEQEQKINMLLAVREALVEQVVASNAEYFYDKEEYKDIVESFAENNLFERMNDSAYPDIDLPNINLSFNKVKKVNPAFYYFNPEIKGEELEKLKSNRKKILEGSLKFKKRIKEGIIASKPVNFDDIDDTYFMRESKSLLMNVTPAGQSASSQFLANLTQSEEPTEVEPAEDPDDKKLKEVSLPRVSINLGSFKDQKEYDNYVEAFQAKVEDIRDKVSETRSLFGGKHLLPSETIKILGDIKANKSRSTETSTQVEEYLKQLSQNLGVGNDVNNFSNVETLEKINENSQKNAFSRKGMQNAFPTFRLYIVEEDSIFSGKLTAYDDFYSYGSVIAFDVNSSKDMAASTASIRLQNVSGVLDGTKKSVIRDIDIDNRNIRSNQDDAFQEYIDSVVLRPGVNIQLRAGYENSTKDLDILISGRISDINYSNDGMSTNIIVQSYGVELEQKVKNALATSSNDNKNVFYSTHQLLGSLMLNPELKHFGRIKTGKVFQAGSTQELALDVKDYSNKSNFILNYTNSVFDWLAENALAISLVGAFAPGIIKVGGSFLGKFGWTRTIAGAIGRAGALGKTGLEKWVWEPILYISGYKALAFAGSKLGLAARGIQKADFLLGSPWGAINKELLNKALLQIKTGVKLSDDVLAELSRIESRLDTSVINHIDEITKGFAGSEKLLASQEAKILAYVLEAEGMAFNGIRNYTFGGVATARAALIRSNETVSAIVSQGILRSTSSGLRKYVKFLGKQALASGALAVSFGLIGFLIDMLAYGLKGLENSIGEGYKSIFGSEKDDTLKIMLSPQDDNIYPPNPASYLRRDETRGEFYSLRYKVGRYASETADANFFHVPYMVDNLIDSGFFAQKTLTEKYFEDFKLLFDTRLVIDSGENEYELKNQTIFSVFHEMSLRHPGYIYGVRPYGQSMEYRMFFGLGDQNYWKKDLSFIDTLRLNKIIKGLNNPEKSIPIKDCRILYPEITKDLLDTSKRAERNKGIYLKEIDIRNIITYHALKEYLEKTEDRFVPFRMMHLVDSSKNIVSNDITVSAHDVINTVTVHYQSTYSPNNDVNSLEMAANTAIKENNKRQKIVSGPNIIGPANAYRYGISELMNGAKNVYTGSVLLLGNTKINPWDILVINDNVNRMYGPVEVRSVTHSFSHQTGFLTNVEVSALVSAGDDMLTYGTMSTSIIAQAKEELYKEYSSRAMVENSSGEIREEVYLEIIGKIIEQRFPKKEYSKEIRDAFTDFFKEKLRQSIKESQRNGEPVFLEDIITGEITVPENIRDQIGAVGKVGAGGTGIAMLGEKLFQTSKPGLRNLRSPIGWGMLALFGGFTAMAFGKDAIVDSVESSLNSGNLGKNLFRPVLFSKISNQNLIEIYPLVKDGKPLLTGGFENIPADQTYSNVIGNIFSMVSSGFEAYLEKTSWLNSGATQSVLNWDDSDDFIEVKPSSVATFFKNGSGTISRNIYHYYSKD